MKNTTLVILAAGIGSRFGGGIKQLEPMGLHGEIIMDYSIHDAALAGFNKVVIIIRRDIEEEFKEAIGNRIEKELTDKGVEIEYAFQEFDDLPDGITCPAERKKPWGTGHAVLAVRDMVKEPFCVINADDYYGKEAYRLMHKFLCEDVDQETLAMAGFVLGNTLSDNGGVTRGICHVDDTNTLIGIDETKGITKGDGCAVAGEKTIALDNLVSMNFWGFPAEFMDLLKTGFKEFFERLPEGNLTEEYLLPIYVDELLKKKAVSVKVLPTMDKWFGVTYKEDKESVKNEFRKLIKDGVYQEKLYGDL